MKKVRVRDLALEARNLVPLIITICNIMTAVVFGGLLVIETLPGPMALICIIYLCLSAFITLALILALIVRLVKNHIEKKQEYFTYHMLPPNIAYFFFLYYLLLNHFS